MLRLISDMTTKEIKTTASRSNSRVNSLGRGDGDFRVSGRIERLQFKPEHIGSSGFFILTN